jgi:GT2 family glycosyltransferase
LISAVVVNWNGASYLPRCLEALLDQDPPPAEVILVDNHSDDGSRELVAQRFPSVQVVDTGANRGPCAARNLGVAKARHPFCLLIDNDVVLHPGALRRMQQTLLADPMTAVVQARSLCGDRENVVHYDSADLHFTGVLALHNWFRPLADATVPQGPVGAAVALCMLCRKVVYEEATGFDERLFILYEDNQFSYKVRMRGHRIRLDAQALCTHLGGTAGLSVRSADDAYPGRRTYLHSRNRWFVLLTCMRWRTFLLTLPAQFLYGAVYSVFAHARGHAGQWWRAKWDLLRLLPAAMRARGPAQEGRSVPDRELLVAVPLTLNPGLAETGVKAAVRRCLDRCLAMYWAIVRRLCG